MSAAYKLYGIPECDTEVVQVAVGWPDRRAINSPLPDSRRFFVQFRTRRLP